MNRARSTIYSHVDFPQIYSAGRPKNRGRISSQIETTELWTAGIVELLVAIITSGINHHASQISPMTSVSTTAVICLLKISR